ncbi:recombination mediator RecR [Allohahella marinimesophila]|uniref:Recombination protein RecR n=1 Tax=Allohahella marinimesophila TaxID=1054972 RepID=A0ABP7PEZ2_9GAMM
MQVRLSPSIEHLIRSLQKLPGVGQKSAQRMALRLLGQRQQEAADIALAIGRALENVRPCSRCRNLCEDDVCQICADDSRDISALCVVASPLDLITIEHTGIFRGFYFVLQGLLSPIDGIGPDDIGLADLEKRLDSPGLDEIILATDSTVEGAATAHFIAELAQQRSIRLTTLAQGVPMGGQLGAVDSITLGHALSGRKPYA